MDEYPRITGKLRKAFMASGGIATLDGCVVKEYMTIAKSELDDLCDTIDAIHARLEAAYDRLRAEGEHEYAPESHYMMLPKDADGVPIHVGDVMEGTCPSGKHVSGEVLSIGDGKFWLCNVQFSLRPDYMRHQRLDTWERIIEDALLASGDMNAMAASRTALVARCKALAGDTE